MIILAFTDIHGSEKAIRSLKAKAKKADLLVCTGDITFFETHMARVVKELDSMGKPLLLVHGNHEDEDGLRALCKDRKNITFLHKGFCEVGGYLFFGYGGGGFAVHDREFEHFSHSIRSRRKGKRLVALFHQPPYGTKVDVILDEHVGNESYSGFIRKERPSLVLCGHLHEHNGEQDKAWGSLIVNPGPEGKFIRLK